MEVDGSLQDLKSSNGRILRLRSVAWQMYLSTRMRRAECGHRSCCPGYSDDWPKGRPGMGQSGLGLHFGSVLARRDRNRTCDQVHWPIQAWMRVSVGKAGQGHSGRRAKEGRMAHRQQGRVGEGIGGGSHEIWGRRGWTSRWRTRRGLRRVRRDDLGNSP